MPGQALDLTYFWIDRLQKDFIKLYRVVDLVFHLLPGKPVQY